MSAEVTVLYFARLRETVGMPEEHISLPEGVTTAGHLLAHLTAKDDQKHAAFDGLDIKIAVNQEQATPDTPIKGGDEVALFPPVTGG